jgi:AcrR family transcriptional regulator
VNVLLEAAAQVFHREGFAATTNRIAERAGVSIGTLYQYFPNKEAMLRALAEHHIAAAEVALHAVFDELRRELPPFDETMRTLLTVVVDLHSDRPGLHRVMHRLAPRAVRDLDTLRALEQRITDEVEFHLKRCDRGDGDEAMTAEAIVAAVDAHVHRVMTRAGRDRSAAQLTALVTALAPPPR